MLKSIARRLVREDYWLFLSWYRDLFGFSPAVLGYLHLLRNKGIARTRNPLTKGYVFIRPGTIDQNVYEEIFIAKKYDLDLGDPLFIVDAGAHIGLASVFFASKYPKATVVALEPEVSNFNLLLRNAKDYPKIKPIRAGLWSRKTHLRIQNPSAPTWAFRVSEDSSMQGIPALGIGDVLADFNADHIDILKMDIEGSELEVLTNHHSWIDAVKTLVIELHDRFQPGCSEALAEAIGGHEYEKSVSGECIVIANLRRIVV
jgi:FkbM family methyltransferase